MGLLNDLFSNVVFSEIDPLFDEMEKMFLSLMEGYDLNLLGESTDDGMIYHQMEELLSRWDENNSSRSRELDVYFELSRDIYRQIEASYVNKDGEVRQEMIADLETLREWIYTSNYPSFGWVLYHSQRIDQLRRLIELFQKDAPKDILTLRHLFEQGLKRARVEENRYLEYVYDVDESRNI